MDPQEGPAAANLSEDQKREQRAKLVKALSRFKPRDANPQQFYNCVREICIMHNCKVDEGLERAALTWPGLTKRQREIYDSKRHAELPIPVPRRIYRSMGGGKNHKPPPKRMRGELAAKQSKYENLVVQDPKVAAMLVPPPPTRVPLATGNSISSPTPSRTQPVKSLSRILKQISSEKIKTPRRRHYRGKPRLKKQLSASKSGKALPKTKGKRTQKKKKTPKPMTPKAKRLAKEKDLKATYNNWEHAVGSVQRRLLKTTKS